MQKSNGEQGSKKHQGSRYPLPWLFPMAAPRGDGTERGSGSPRSHGKSPGVPPGTAQRRLQHPHGSDAETAGGVSWSPAEPGAWGCCTPVPIPRAQHATRWDL